MKKKRMILLFILIFFMGIFFLPMCTFCTFKIHKLCGFLKFTSEDNDHKSQKITPRMKWEIGFDQSYKCATCWRTLNPSTFELDHILPQCGEINNKRKNLQLLCRLCHGIKTSTIDRPFWLIMNKKKSKNKLK